MYKLTYLKLLTVLLFLVAASPALNAQALTSENYYAQARTEGNKNNFAKAVSYSEKALELSPKDMDIKEYLGKCYMEAGKLDTARTTLLEVLETDPGREDARYYLLNIETRTKRYTSAVCYANELLEISPYSKAIWIKKINLYNLMDNRVEADRSVKRLYQIFPDDKGIRTMYNDVLKGDAMKMAKNNDLAAAARQYELALAVTNDDPGLYLSLINAYQKMGNNSAALQTAEKGLNRLPGNRELFNKKIGILEQQHEYQKALDLVAIQIKNTPSSYYANLQRYLTSEAARYYKNSDPYVLYGKLYAQDKSNMEAHDYLLSTAITKGYNSDALQLIADRLKSDPNSKTLLSKQMLVYESMQNTKAARGVLEKLYLLYPDDTDISEKHDGYAYEDAKIDFAQQNYKAALPAFISLQDSGEYGRFASQYVFAIYLAQQSYDKASETLGALMKKYPGEQQYVLNQIDLYAAMDNYEGAYELASRYKGMYPDDATYKNMLGELSAGYIKYLNQREDYPEVIVVSDRLIAADPNDIQAYSYSIGAWVAMGRHEEAIQLINTALMHYPESKDLKLKLAGVYSEAGQPDKAVEVLRALQAEYPYNNDIRGSLIEQMFRQASFEERRKEPGQAKGLYNEILALKPADTLAAIKLSALMADAQQYADALQVLDNSLTYNRDNPELLYHKGLIYEKMADYSRAQEFQAGYVPPAHKYQEYKDHLRYLESKLLKNQVNISYLNVQIDSLAVNASVATVEYLRFDANNTYIARINYAARYTGIGVQGEADWYHTFSDKSNFLANVGVASEFFPKFKAAFSYFRPFRNEWQAEVGGRYARLTDDRDFFTGILGLEKTYGRVWLNARAFMMSDGEEVYNNVLLQARFYLENESDYALVMASAGNAPEDQRLDFQLNTFLSYTNTMVGAGYYHYLGYRTSIGLVGNWYNYQFRPDVYINQYNIFLILRTKF